MKLTTKSQPNWLNASEFILDRVKLSPDEHKLFISKLPPGAYARAGKLLNLCRTTVFRNVLPKKRCWYDKRTIETLQHIIRVNSSKHFR